jgi:transposase-like protein
MSKQNVQTQRRYPPELRERAVRMVKRAIAQAGGERHGVVTRVAIQLGMGSETLRHWVKQAEVDSGQRRRRGGGVLPVGRLSRDSSGAGGDLLDIRAAPMMRAQFASSPR